MIFPKCTVTIKKSEEAIQFIEHRAFVVVIDN